jgi:HEAT repeat protein
LVCEQHGARDALPTARILAQTGENTHLRMVAIKTLGSMGEPRDEELLKSMAKDPDTNVAAVAAMALARVGGQRRE